MGNVIILGTSDSIVAVMSGAAATTNPSFNAGWVDTTTDSTNGSKNTLNGTSEVTVVAAPSADQRQVDFIRIYNGDTASVTVTVSVANGASRYPLGKWTIASGYSVDVMEPPSLMVAGADYEVPLTFSSSLSRAANAVTFVNDSATPGNSYYYGTNGSGAKGYFALPSSMVYPGAGIVLSTGSAWGTSITDNSANWNTAYGWGNHASGGYVKTDQTSGQTIGATGTRLTMLWVTDITCTNAIAGSVTGNAGTVTNATFTTAFTNQGGAGVLVWPAAGATLTVPTGGGTLGSAAFTASGDYATASHTQAVSTISDASTVGQNLVKLTNPSAIAFPRFNANNTVDALSAADFKTAIGAGSGGGGDGAGGLYYQWLNFGGFMGGP